MWQLINKQTRKSHISNQNIMLRTNSENIINPHNVADGIILLLIVQKTFNYVADFQGTSATMPNDLIKSG
jgi:hypothetical protein